MQKITDNVIYVGLNDVNRDFFDELLPLEKGTSYNSYFIKGSEKTALIDTMYAKKADIYFEELEKAGVDNLDYIVANHGEQDHTGVLPKLLEKFPKVIIVTNETCKTNLMNMLDIPEDRIKVIQNNEILSLGDKNLQFIFAPNVHWPDTMFTYLVEDKFLFTIDFLGSHFVNEDIFAKPSEQLERAAKKYYAEILMPFRPLCKKYLQMIKELNPSVILPAHGPIYKDTDFILKLYEDWTSDECKNLILFPYVSMYNSSKQMVDYVAEKLEQKGIECIKFDLIRDNIADLAVNLVDAKSIVLGCSMVLASPHPAAHNACYLLSLLKPKAKNFGILASYGWGGRLTEPLIEMLSKLRRNLIEPVIIRGKMKQEHYALLDEFVDKLISAN